MSHFDDITSTARQVVRNAERVSNSADVDALNDLLRTIEDLAKDVPPHFSERSDAWRDAYRVAYDVVQGEPGDELVDVVDSAISDYRQSREDYPENDASDLAFEIADGAVPVYTYQRMQVIAGSIHVATYEVESGLVSEDADMVTMAGVVICEIVRDCLAVVEREIEDSDDDSDGAS